MEISTLPKRRRVECSNNQVSDGTSSVNLGFVHLRSLDPDSDITSSTMVEPGGLIRIRPNQVYTVGRKKRFCEIFTKTNRRISRIHCQFFFDGSCRKLLLIDGSFKRDPSVSEDVNLLSENLKVSFTTRHSMNGVFVNGRRIDRGSLCELSVGDKICLSCCCCKSRESIDCGYGLVVESIAFFNADKLLDGKVNEESKGLTVLQRCLRDELNVRALALMGICRGILQSKDPISCIRKSLNIEGAKKVRVLDTIQRRTFLEKSVSDSEKTRETLKFSSQQDCQLIHPSDEQVQIKDSGMENREEASKLLLSADCVGTSENRIGNNSSEFQSQVNYVNLSQHSDGKTLYLNRLAYSDPESSENHMTVSLQELLHPVGSLLRIFITTFTCDVSWFLSYCEIPKSLQITIACHDSERGWNSSPGSGTCVPFADYPNLLLIFPPFPNEIAFGSDPKKRGVGCHHPKLILLQREDSIRVIITSANLVCRQWNNITNTVWWQDFPCGNSPDYSVLFYKLPCNVTGTRNDFVAQLAGFVASLIANAPSESYWITELAKYDYEGAFGYLVASKPGIHIQFCSPSNPDFILSGLEILRSQTSSFKLLGYVQSTVVGLSHRFHCASDSTGAELKMLASFLKKCKLNASGFSEVVLRRSTNIAADVNAVGVLVVDMDMFPKGVQDVHHYVPFQETCYVLPLTNLLLVLPAYVQLGFLPRDVAKWVSPLSDAGFFSFSASIDPKEALTAAFGGGNIKIQLILHISQGPNFSDLSRYIEPEHVASLCSLLASIQRCIGIWRLQEVTCQYKWPESLETDFVYGSSSIGTSVCPKYLASFSAAAGKKSLQYTDSEESDPEWGRWTTSHELKCPSLSFLFPTIERVKHAICGTQFSRCLLAFSEKTWQKLRFSGILRDAVPHPCTRLGHPMHVKVACRRFQSKTDATSFGWIYCGSHNFSPAAWGHEMQYPKVTKAVNSEANASRSVRLHICNYELGIIFVFPPPTTDNCDDGKKSNMDDIQLPFVMPAPKYSYDDRPATAQAMREVAVLEKESQLTAVAADEAMDEEIADDEIEDVDYVTEEEEEEKIYAEMLWSQTYSAGSQ